MAGIDRQTGKPIGRADHIAQRIEAILTTPQGTRVMRRELGVNFLNEDGSSKEGLSEQAVHDEAFRALREYEQRAEFISVTPEVAEGRVVKIKVVYRDKEGGERTETTVRYV